MTNQLANPIADEFPLADAQICRNAPEMVARAYNELRARAIALEKAALRVARLNPTAGEIGAGMLATIVNEAQAALN